MEEPTDRERLSDRFVRDLRDLAKARRKQANALNDLAEDLEEDEVTVEEVVEKCRERQLLVEVLPNF